MLRKLPFFLTIQWILLTGILCDPRSRTVELLCSPQLEHNTTAYVPNFISAMQTIADKIQFSGYGVAAVGSGPDKNYGLGQCHGDLSSLDCVLCYAEMRTILPKCFPYNGGRIYLDGCFLRSENYSFFEEFSDKEDKPVCGNKTRASEFNIMARRAVSRAIAGALQGDFFGRASVSSAHAMASCWKTLNYSSCESCLKEAAAMAAGCLPASEGRALKTGCFLRYSDTDFLNPIIVRHPSNGIIVPIVFAALSVVFLLGMMVGVGHYFRKRRKIERKRNLGAENMKSTFGKSNLNFKFSVLERATGSFSIENKIGQGGFGSVYKGFLPDGREIAVKRLYLNHKHRGRDFYNEVNIVSNVEHKNLVRLLGCSCLGPESLLVYEFVPNKSLNLFIFDSERGKLLNWEKRFEIIRGTTEGLAYLHENPKIRIIHRDIKASNILLDARFRAKIADFGLARSFQEDKSHVSTAIAGTLGYMAPEYLALGQLTEKADIYSLGVLMMEIIAGKSNNLSSAADNSEGIITQMWKSFKTGTVPELIDPNMGLQEQDNPTKMEREIIKTVHVCLLCTQEIPSLRPSASEVLRMLRKREEELLLPPPTRPPFIDEKTMELGDLSNHLSADLSDGHIFSVASVSEDSFCPR